MRKGIEARRRKMREAVRRGVIVIVIVVLGLVVGVFKVGIGVKMRVLIISLIRAIIQSCGIGWDGIGVNKSIV
jgi:hypothetical protein